MTTKKKSKDVRPFEFNPSIFQPGPKAGFLEQHIVSRARSLGKYTLYALTFVYPIILVSLGVEYGGLVFWGSLTGSMVIVGLMIKKAGYAANFADWGIGYKKFLALPSAFAILLSVYYGLVYSPLGGSTFLVLGGILAVIFTIGIWKITR